MAEHAIPFDILDDLSSRFIINVPEEERKDLVRICFQIELAHWFYLDFYCPEDSSKLRACTMNEFALHIFQHIPFLMPHVLRLNAVLEQWRDYKQSVPTFGAIVLNDDMSKVLLVQNYWSKNSWGFPKGKVNEDEDPSHCAVREVLEETGFDISRLIDKNEYIESVINDRLVRLYIITGVQKDTKFQPQTRKEIKNVEWFSLADLPNTARDMTPKVKMGVGPNAFFMVVPFVKRMKRWVLERQQKEKQASINRNRRKSLGDADLFSKNNRRQSGQNSWVFDGKKGQSNTSPVRGKRQLESKCVTKAGTNGSDKNSTKAPIKRNLFGDTNRDDKRTKSPALAKQLLNSPRECYPSKAGRMVRQHSDLGAGSTRNISTMLRSISVRNGDSENYNNKYDQQSCNSYDVRNGNKENFNNYDQHSYNSYDVKNGNNENYNKYECQSPNPYDRYERRFYNRFEHQSIGKFDHQSREWKHFRFDKKAILNCIDNRV